MAKDERPIADNLQAPEIFSDGIIGLFFLNGNMRFTFEVIQNDHTKEDAPERRTVVGRLILPLERARAMHNDLGKFLKLIDSGAQQTAVSTTTLQ